MNVEATVLTLNRASNMQLLLPLKRVLPIAEMLAVAVAAVVPAITPPAPSMTVKLVEVWVWASVKSAVSPHFTKS